LHSGSGRRYNDNLPNGERTKVLAAPPTASISEVSSTQTLEEAFAAAGIAG
jgi:hypothetical protein